MSATMKLSARLVLFGGEEMQAKDGKKEERERGHTYSAQTRQMIVDCCFDYFL